MGLLERVAAARGTRQLSRADGPFDPSDYWFSTGGYTYYGTPSSTYNNTETIEGDFTGLVQYAYKQNTVIWAVERTRLSVFSEARFQFRQIRNGRLGDYFGTQDLAILERPWLNGTTGDLLTRMLQDADFAGNAYFTRRGDQLRRLRPDWVSILLGSHDDPAVTPADLDAELLGYVYWPGGHLSGKDPEVLMPDEVAHFAPTPDPMASYRGMSWLTPVIREIMADSAATEHKLSFFRNGATPQVVVSFDKDARQEAVEAFRRKMDASHQGAHNAYRTIYVGGGADVTVVGTDLKQLDFKATQGAGETRIAAAGGAHPTIVGLSEGMQGSSLNAGNFAQTRRLLSEVTLSTLWRNAAASMSTLVPAPSGSELACDTRDIPFLREDQRDAADIQQVKASTIRQLIDAGFEPKSVVASVDADDRSLLVHTGLFSVQLQPPGSGQAPTGAPGDAGPKGPAAAQAVRKFNPSQPRDPHSGEWIGVGGALHKLADLLGNAVKHHAEWGHGGTVAQHEDGAFTISRPGGGLAAYIVDDDLGDLRQALGEASDYHHGRGDPGEAEGGGWRLAWDSNGTVLHGEDENEDPTQLHLSPADVDSLESAAAAVDGAGDTGGDLPAGYTAKYGRIIEDNPVTGTDLSVVVNDQGQTHIARGDGPGRTVPVELDDYDAGELGDDLLAIAAETAPSAPHKYANGITITGTGDGGVRLEWPDGSADTLTAHQATELGNLLSPPEE